MDRSCPGAADRIRECREPSPSSIGAAVARDFGVPRTRRGARAGGSLNPDRERPADRHRRRRRLVDRRAVCACVCVGPSGYADCRTELHPRHPASCLRRRPVDGRRECRRPACCAVDDESRYQ